MRYAIKAKGRVHILPKYIIIHGQATKHAMKGTFYSHKIPPSCSLMKVQVSH